MTSTTTSLLNSHFGGIRRKDACFTQDKITCSDCQNAELFYTELNSGIGVRTASGNIAVSNHTVDDELVSLFPDDEYIVGMFEAVLDGTTYFFVYTENETVGKLYTYDDIGKTLTQITTNNTLEVTSKACATTFEQGWLDMFIFSNGRQVVYLKVDTSQPTPTLAVESSTNIHLIDSSDTQTARDVYGLGMKVFDDRLWIFNGKVLWYSKQLECRDFRPSGNDYITDAGFIEFVKPITAIYPYLGSLAVFHKDSSSLVQTDSTTRFVVSDESPGGCASYDSLVFHGTDLYFYDDTKKGVFSFQQVINGDKTLGDNIALDIQRELMEIKSENVHLIRAFSVVTYDRNEVWFLIPISDDENYSFIMIFDYLRGEWVKRKCQHINCVTIVDSVFYSGGKDIYEEYFGYDFNGEWIESNYKCTIFNLGADNTLKITKFPPRVTIDGNSKCDFWVRYLKNYDQYKSPKLKEIKAKTYKGIITYDSGYDYDSDNIYTPTNVNAVVKLPSSTFKALEITFFTKSVKQEFAIKAIEFSKLKVKQV